MSTAKRRINSTGRQRIRRDSVEVRMLDSASGGPLSAKATLDLSPLKFPADAVVAIEAYHRSSGQRFECGTVGKLSVPSELLLDQVDRDGSVLFRLKVIDTGDNPGRILGSAERIQPVNENEVDGKKSLFPVLFRRLGPEIWKVEAEQDDRPRLILNTDIPGIAHRLQNDPLLQGFLLPAAFRIVLERLVQQDAEEDEDEGQDWRSEWLEYCQAALGVSGEPSSFTPERRADWVDDAIRKFCELNGFIDRMRRAEEEGDQK